jgi:hypothetical protein
MMNRDNAEAPDTCITGGADPLSNGGSVKLVNNVLLGNGKCYMSGVTDPQTSQRSRATDYHPRRA